MSEGGLVTYSFCEPAWASTLSYIHIRDLEGGEQKPGGGIDTPTLCGRLPTYGWDVLGEVTFNTIKAGLTSEANPVCPKCARKWGYLNGIEQDPEPRGWMTPDGTLDVENAEPFYDDGKIEGQRSHLVVIDEAADFDPGF